jgi:nitrate reductase molybdenum cofactor assembly chaperone NarJ/NarW
MKAGFFLATGELPDFVPVFLEFTSCLERRQAREMLAEPVHVFAALAERLDKRPSPYAAIFHGLVALAGERPDAQALAELEERAPDDDPSRIDEEWEEAPVSFSAGAAHEMGGPTGFTAKIRASNRPAGRESGQ